MTVRINGANQPSVRSGQAEQYTACHGSPATFNTPLHSNHNTTQPTGNNTTLQPAGSGSQRIH